MSKGPAEWSKLLATYERLASKSPASASKLLVDASKDPASGSKGEANGSNDVASESKTILQRRREGAKAVKTFLKELLNGANSYSQVADALANYSGEAANEVFKGATATILEMLSHSMARKSHQNNSKNELWEANLRIWWEQLGS